MGKMNLIELLSLFHYVWSLLQLFYFYNLNYFIPVVIHILIAVYLYIDWQNTNAISTQTEKILGCVQKTDASTSMHGGLNPFLNQLENCNNPFLNPKNCIETENVKIITDNESESTIDEAMALWKPYTFSNLNSSMTNPFLNPFYDLLTIEDPLAHLDQESEDGQINCAKWVVKHQNLFFLEIDFNP